MDEEPPSPDHFHSRKVMAPHAELLMCSETLFTTKGTYSFFSVQ